MAMYGNGVAADSIADAQWVKASASGPVEDCVEVAQLANGDVAMRNSRYPAGPALVYTRSEFAAFLSGARGGEFDGMTV
jgi:hypothetical protein